MKLEDYQERLYQLWVTSQEITNELYDILLQLEEPPDGLHPSSVEEVYRLEYLRRILKDRNIDRSYSLLGCNLWTNTQEEIQEELRYHRGYMVSEEDQQSVLLQYLQDGYILGTRKIREILDIPKSTAYRLICKMMELPNIEKTQKNNGAFELKWRKDND